MKTKTIGIIGCVIVLIIVFIAIFSDLIAPYDADKIVGPSFQRPSADHLLGTNDIGQDIFSELVVGAKYSLLVGLFSMLISAAIGIIIGLTAGWYGGLVDNVLMKITYFIQMIPYLPLVIVLAALLKGGLWSIVLVMGMTSWPEMARVLRMQTIKVKESDYITSIAAMGAPSIYIIFRHVLRDLLPLVVYRVISRFKSAIIAESSLSFLGLSSSTIKSWGSMLYYAQAKSAFLTDAWLWWVIPPGIMISILSFGFMMVGYSIEGKMDPRLDGGRW